jgi:hypothetical protein
MAAYMAATPIVLGAKGLITNAGRAQAFVICSAISPPLLLLDPHQFVATET